MTKVYEARPYRQGDGEGIVELLQLVFNGWPHLDLSCTPIDHWRWKFKDNPLGMIFIGLGISDKKIIGCHHSIPLRIKIGNKVLLCSSSVDFAVHPDFRRIGVSRKIVDLNSERREIAGVKFTYYLTGNPIVIESQIRSGIPRFPYHIINLVRIKDIDKQLRIMPVENAWLMKLGYYTAKLYTFFRYAISGREFKKQDLNISEIKSFTESIDEFWEEISKSYEFIVERRRDFLNWRYCDSRGGDFIVRQAEHDGKILGYSVLRINKYNEEYPIGYIVDLLTLPNRLDIAEALTADAIRYFDYSDINIVNYMAVEGHPYEKILKRHRFLDSRIRIHLFYTPGKDDALKKIDHITKGKVYISWGDHDVLPVRMPTNR